MIGNRMAPIAKRAEMARRKTASSMTWHLRFDGVVDADGYALKEFEAVESQSIAASIPQGWHLVPIGGVTERYRLQDLESRERGKPAFTEFANLILAGGGLDPQRLLSFVSNYGMPSADPTNPMDLGQIAFNVNEMRKCLSAIMREKGTVTLGGWAGNPDVCVEFIESPKGTKKLITLQVKTLPTLLWTQLFMALQQGIEIKQCIVCGNFMAPKSEKRDTCSDACRQKIYRRRDENQATHGPHDDHA